MNTKYLAHTGLSALVAFAAATFLVDQPAGATDGYPTQPVEVVIPYPPGGSDTLGRRIAETMTRMTGAELVMMNVPGASTQVASRQIANAEPNGYRIYIASPPEFLAGPVFYDDLGFDPMRDFTLISFTAEAPYLLLVDPRLGTENHEEFEAHLRENPDDVRFGSYGTLSQSDIIARRYRAETGIDFDIIPYAGGTPAFNALIAGEIHALFGTTIPTRGFIADGQMAPMAATTAERTPLYPNVPTLQELGFDLVDSASYGLVGPAGLPDDIVEYWHNAWREAMNEPETRGFIEDMGVTVIGSTPEEFRDWLDENSALWATFPEELGLNDN
jgi:tripartite-type tricarboxylate transporter receptor subunit TctC